MPTSPRNHISAPDPQQPVSEQPATPDTRPRFPRRFRLLLILEAVLAVCAVFAAAGSLLDWAWLRPSPLNDAIITSSFTGRTGSFIGWSAGIVAAIEIIMIFFVDRKRSFAHRLQSGIGIGGSVLVIITVTALSRLGWHGFSWCALSLFFLTLLGYLGSALDDRDAHH